MSVLSRIPHAEDLVLAAARKVQLSSFYGGFSAISLQRILFPLERRCAAKRLGISSAIQRLKRKGLAENYKNWRGFYILTDTEKGK